MGDGRSENRDESLRFKNFYVQISSSYVVLLFRVCITTSLSMSRSSVQEDVLRFMCPSDESASTSQPSSWSSTVQARFSLPASYVLKPRVSSLSFGGYLIRPSLLTGPISDLGSGDRELHEVLEQGPAAKQEEVCVLHRSPVTQNMPTLLSTHASSG